MRRTIALLVSASLAVVGGCGTIANMRGQTVTQMGPQPFPCSTKPFGGVIQDVDVACALPCGFILLGDLPLSFVGDLVTLPWTTLVYVYDQLNPTDRVGQNPPISPLMYTRTIESSKPAIYTPPFFSDNQEPNAPNALSVK
jgi:hypothetical protein